MRIFIIGGTGLLGSEAAKLFITQGHSVVSVALPPLPKDAILPKEMEIVFGNYLDMDDAEIARLMKGCDCFVFAAGIDDRIELPAPVYDAYKKYNIDSLERLLRIAKTSGVKNSVILGSYFCYFSRIYPSMRLPQKHPYIQSRIIQEQVALSFADDKMGVAILELPYIFGVQPGRKPVWTILIEQLSKMGNITFYPRGGSAMVTVRQVAQSIVGAALNNKGGNTYPIGYYNYTWDEFLSVAHRAIGQPERKIIHISKQLFMLYGKYMLNFVYKKNNIDPGIRTDELAHIMNTEMFIDKKWSIALGVTDDDIDQAIFDSVKQSADAFSNEQNYVAMKGE